MAAYEEYAIQILPKRGALTTLLGMAIAVAVARIGALRAKGSGHA